MRSGREAEQGPNPDMHVAVQEDVARLEVQVQQRRVHAVEEVHGQAGLVDGADLELPAEAVGRQHLLQGPVGHELHHDAQGLRAHPVDGRDALLHFGGSFNEAVHVGAVEGAGGGEAGGVPLMTPAASRTHAPGWRPGCGDAGTALGACRVAEEEGETRKGAQQGVQTGVQTARSRKTGSKGASRLGASPFHGGGPEKPATYSGGLSLCSSPHLGCKPLEAQYYASCFCF